MNVKDSHHLHIVDKASPTQVQILVVQESYHLHKIRVIHTGSFGIPWQHINNVVGPIFLTHKKIGRPVSVTLKEAVNDQDTEEVFIVLLTIEHPDMEDTLYFTLDAVNTISRGNTYLALPFELTPPEESPDQPPVAKLVLDNVDRQIVYLLRSISSPLTVKFEVVLSSDPDMVEAVWEGFQLRNIKYDALTIQGDLTLENFLQEPYPSGVFCPAWFPGLF